MQNAYYFLQLYFLYFSVVVKRRYRVLFHSSLRFVNIVELVVNMHKVCATRSQELNKQSISSETCLMHERNRNDRDNLFSRHAIL
jgi:hypothetical protein